MDRFDLAILSELERDGRIGFSELGERVGLSKTPCWKRVQALEQAGVIQGYKAQLDPAALGVGLNAFVQVMIAFDQRRAFEVGVVGHPAVLACYTTAGDGDYLLHVVAEGVAGLDALLREDLSLLPGVQRFSTTICLTAIKEQGPLTALRDAGR